MSKMFNIHAHDCFASSDLNITQLSEGTVNKVMMTQNSEES